MAAIFAARAGSRTILLESTKDGGRKILISGGGRCNVLPSTMHPSQYVTESSPNTLKKILLSWPLAAQRAFFEEDLGIPLVLEPETGKLFPRANNARAVRDALLDAAWSAGASIRFNQRMTKLERDGSGAWLVHIAGEAPLHAGRVVIATGGLSVPNTGSDGAGLALLARLGHTIHATYPALTPLTADPPVHAALAGISLTVTLRAPQPRGEFTTTGGFLFTHRGYSGPSVLDISHLAVRTRGTETPQSIHVQWRDEDAAAWDEKLRVQATGTVASMLRRDLPDRLAERLIAASGVAPDRSLAELRRDERARLVTVLARYPLPWTGDEGYKKAEVTGGGVSLAEVDPRTLESRLHPGLHVCGEALDAFGPIGGYNFCWAWATGRAAGIGSASANKSISA